MNIAEKCIDLGAQFAAALDSCDYSRAATYLADLCRYERPGQGTLVGPQAICDSYQESDLRARRRFSWVCYLSAATADESGGVRLTFSDELSSGRATHTFHCAQIVYFDESQKIDRIVLVEMSGERDLLNEFCAAHRIQSP
jgi:hypothetical protein